MYVASPWDLNDPWEGRPSFAMPDQATDPSAIEPYIDALAKLVPDKTRDDAAKWLRENGLEVVTQQFQDVHYRNNAGLGVLSFAGNATHPLMWSYYGDGHRGFCWELNPQSRLVGAASKVSYQTDYPEIDWRTWEEQDVTGLSLLAKASFWEHEDEYRLLVPRRDAPELFPIVPYAGDKTPPRGRYLRLDGNAIIGVIFGAGMPPEARAQLAAEIQKHRPDITLKVAGIHRRKYEMEIRPLTEVEKAKLLR